MVVDASSAHQSSPNRVARAFNKFERAGPPGDPCGHMRRALVSECVPSGTPLTPEAEHSPLSCVTEN